MILRFSSLLFARGIERLRVGALRVRRLCKQILLRGIHTGRYVLMPDHVHLFVSLSGSLHLEHYVRLLKQCLNRTLQRESEPGRLWQPGFFDHLIRAHESDQKKWEYVLQNPVRAGLVERSQDWPYQGEIERIHVM